MRTNAAEIYRSRPFAFATDASLRFRGILLVNDDDASGRALAPARRA
jgi:hypothetical protein